MSSVVTNSSAISTVGGSKGLTLPSRYFWTALASFLILTALIPLAAVKAGSGVQDPHFLALTHLAVLGWATMVAMGALFQLVPVILEVALWSEALGRCQFWFYTLGVVGLAGSFWLGRLEDGVPFSGFLVGLGILFFLFNMGCTLTRVRKIDITGAHILAALFWFALTALSGLALGLNFRAGFLNESVLETLRGHLYLGLWGWLSLLIIGVSYKLFPMFTLSHGYSLRCAKVAFFLGNTGLLAILVGDWFPGSPPALIQAGILFLAAAVFAYGVQVLAMGRSRLRPFGPAIRYALSAVLYLHAAAVLQLLRVLGILHDSPNFALGLGVLVVLGWISMSIVGYLYKIFPHLVWLGKYGDKVGLEPVPAMEAMVDERFPRFGFYIFQGGILGLALGFLLANPLLIQLSGALLLVSTATLVLGMSQAERA